MILIFQQINPIYRPTETGTPQQEKLQKTYDKFGGLLEGPLAPMLGDSIQRIKTGKEDETLSDKELEQAANMNFEKGQAISKWQSVIGGEILKIIVFNNRRKNGDNPHRFHRYKFEFSNPG